MRWIRMSWLKSVGGRNANITGMTGKMNLCSSVNGRNHHGINPVVMEAEVGSCKHQQFCGFRHENWIFLSTIPLQQYLWVVVYYYSTLHRGKMKKKMLNYLTRTTSQSSIKGIFLVLYLLQQNVTYLHIFGGNQINYCKISRKSSQAIGLKNNPCSM